MSKAPMNRERRLMLLKWLKQDYINTDELKVLADEVLRGVKPNLLTQQEAREFIKQLEEQY